MPMTKWKIEAANEYVYNVVAHRVATAGKFLRDHLKEKMSERDNSRGGNASAPGEYPARVTGILVKSIRSEFDRKALTARVGSDELHGKFLEFGTSKMAPRPWLSNGVRDCMEELRSILNGGAVLK
jgi:hypothetical protein